MATKFSQVNLTQDDEMVDWQYTSKNNGGKRKRRLTRSSSVPLGDDFNNVNNSTKLSVSFEDILN